MDYSIGSTLLAIFLIIAIFGANFLIGRLIVSKPLLQEENRRVLD